MSPLASVRGDAQGKTDRQRAALWGRTWGYRWTKSWTRAGEEQTRHRGHEASGMPADSLALHWSTGRCDLPLLFLRPCLAVQLDDNTECVRVQAGSRAAGRQGGRVAEVTGQQDNRAAQGWLPTQLLVPPTCSFRQILCFTTWSPAEVTSVPALRSRHPKSTCPWFPQTDKAMLSFPWHRGIPCSIFHCGESPPCTSLSFSH